MNVRTGEVIARQQVQADSKEQVLQMVGHAATKLREKLGKSLIYVSRASGNWDIYLRRIGGKNPTDLTKDSLADDTQPAFSPDGERIAFRSEREGGGIYIMGATGESVRRVSDFGHNPVWSPMAKRFSWPLKASFNP